jgi:hypothetical protein
MNPESYNKGARETLIARQRLSKHINSRANAKQRKYATMEELSEAMFSIRTAPRLQKESILSFYVRFFITYYHFNQIDRLCYMCVKYILQSWSLFIKGKLIISSEKMLRKEYYRKGSVAK